MIGALLWLSVALGGDVLGWRRDGTGVFPDATPPTRWSTTESVAWKTPMPARSNASPIVVGGTVFVTAEPTALIAVRSSDGAVLWRRDHGVEITRKTQAERDLAKREMAEIPTLRVAVRDGQRAVSELRRAARAGGSTPDLLARIDAATKDLYAKQGRLDALEARYPTPPEEQSSEYASGFVGFSSSTPVSDGRRVYVVFANGVVAARELDGTLAWATWVGAPATSMRGYHEGHAASPVIAGGVLVVGIGALTGLDLATGVVRWRGAAYEDFGTPAVVQVGADAVVVTPGGDVVRGRDGLKLGSLGRTLWYTGPLPRPGGVWLVGNHTSDTASGSDYTLGLNGSALSTSSRWTAALPTDRYYGAPAPWGGLLNMVSRHGQVLALHASGGAVAFRETFDLGAVGEIYSSPCVAGDLLFITSDAGNTLVLRVTPQGYQRVGVNPLEELRSSLVFSGRDVYARGMKYLWKLRGG